MQKEPKAAENGSACLELLRAGKVIQRLPLLSLSPLSSGKSFQRAVPLSLSLLCFHFTEVFFKMWRQAQIGLWAYREKSWYIGPDLMFHTGWGMGWTLLVL